MKHHRPNRTIPTLPLALGLIAAALSAGCAGSAAQRADAHLVGPVPTFDCPEGSEVRSPLPRQGIVAMTCVRKEPDAPAGELAHGPDILVVRRRCADGSDHELEIQRRFVHGIAQGPERARLDGKPAWSLSWRDGRPGVANVEVGFDARSQTGWTHHDGCDGMLLCGERVGFSRCADGVAGQFVDGRRDGPGEARSAMGVLASTFRGGVAEGADIELEAPIDAGDRWTGYMRGGERHGPGRLDFGGGWLVGQWREGHYDGRVTVEYPTGVRVVTRWHNGQMVQLLRKLRMVGPPEARREEVLYTHQGRINGQAPAKSEPRQLVAWSREEVANDDGDTVRVRFWRVFTTTGMRNKALIAAIAEQTGVDRDSLRLMDVERDWQQAQAALTAALQPKPAQVAGGTGGKVALILTDRGALVFDR